MSKDKVPSHNAQPFFNTIREIRRGVFLDEAADAMQEVVRAVDVSGKSAKLIIEIAVSPAARVGGAVRITDKITTKLPAEPAGETIMFMTVDANLVANDPHQQELNLKSVDTGSNQALKQAS
jgi:hypothetical protein